MIVKNRWFVATTSRQTEQEKEMEELFSIDNILAVGGLFTTGGIGALIGWKYQQRKAKAEADQAAAEAEKTAAEAERARQEAVSAAIQATKDMQDMYQQMNSDIKTDRDEQKAYIQELKDDRRHLREERDELRKRQDDLEEIVRGLQRDVARNGRAVESMRPLLCGIAATCKLRQRVTISDEGVVDRPRRRTTKTEK